MYLDGQSQDARKAIIYYKEALLGTVVRIDTDLGYFDRKVKQPDGTWKMEHVHFEPGDIRVEFRQD